MFNTYFKLLCNNKISNENENNNKNTLEIKDDKCADGHFFWIIQRCNTTSFTLAFRTSHRERKRERECVVLLCRSLAHERTRIQAIYFQFDYSIYRNDWVCSLFVALFISCIVAERFFLPHIFICCVRIFESFMPKNKFAAKWSQRRFIQPSSLNLVCECVCGGSFVNVTEAKNAICTKDQVSIYGIISINYTEMRESQSFIDYNFFNFFFKNRHVFCNTIVVQFNILFPSFHTF